MLLGSSERSVRRKLRESVLALRLEHRFSKREIAAMYLNLAPYGNRIHGVARASRVYFGCRPEDLTAAQAAFLASLPQRPSAFNPLRDANRAMERQRYVLAAMPLTPRHREEALRERLLFRRDRHDLIAQHFVERALRLGQTRTSLDSPLQRDVAGIVSAHKQRLIAHGAHAVAVAVLDNRSGSWLAWEGSGDYFGESFGGAIDGVVTPRQPGSALKPFTYAVAFERGFSPATVLADVPSHFPTAEEGVVYTPRNYDGHYRGPLRVRAALAGSENVPAVAMLSRIGPASLLGFLRHAGFDTFSRTADYYGLGLTLGDAEVRLDQLVAAYAVFARGGTSVDGRRLVSRRTAFWITDILSDAEAREYVFGSGGSLDFPFRVAAKTGTSQAYRDNWTIGYTRDVTVGVWVGNFDRSPLRNASGVTGAGPIFHAVMLAAVKRVRGGLPIGDASPIVAAPPDVERLPVCALSGRRPSTYCEALAAEWLPVEAPAEFCSWHHQGCVSLPPDYAGWGGAVDCSRLPQLSRVSAKPPHSRLRVTNPADGATFLIDPTLRMSFQTLRLRAASETAVRWTVDGKAVESEWPLRRGRHTIAATDARGNRDEVRIYVK
jgi:penicillin-binding protein 1C